MDPFSSLAKPKQKATSYKNLIEALKNTGKTDQQPAQNSLKIQEQLKAREHHIRQQERTRFESIRREEKVIYSREKQQVKIQIETLQTQIQALSKEQIGLLGEMEKTAFQAVVNPGTYHQNFFERLLGLIKLAKKKIAESRSWMQLHNQRAKKRSHYWQNVKTSGTKFMLSQERYSATQAG